jgi:predicted dinucleotide-binding enzyme
MSIGIIGAGALGSNVARLLARSGIRATIANRREPESLAGLVEELGPLITAGTVEQAASADMVLVAVRWTDLAEALSGLRGVGRPCRDRRHEPCGVSRPELG